MPNKQQLFKKFKQTKGFLSNLIKFYFHQKSNIPLIVDIYLLYFCWPASIHNGN